MEFAVYKKRELQILLLSKSCISSYNMYLSKLSFHLLKEDLPKNFKTLKKDGSLHKIKEMVYPV